MIQFSITPRLYPFHDKRKKSSNYIENDWSELSKCRTLVADSKKLHDNNLLSWDVSGGFPSSFIPRIWELQWEYDIIIIWESWEMTRRKIIEMLISYIIKTRNNQRLSLCFYCLHSCPCKPNLYVLSMSFITTCIHFNYATYTNPNLNGRNVHEWVMERWVRRWNSDQLHMKNKILIIINMLASVETLRCPLSCHIHFRLMSRVQIYGRVFCGSTKMICKTSTCVMEHIG